MKHFKINTAVFKPKKRDFETTRALGGTVMKKSKPKRWFEIQEVVLNPAGR